MCIRDRFGANLQYKLNHKWDLQIGTTYSPANDKELQPATVFHSAGFHYTLRELSKDRVDLVKKAGYHFPKQILSVAYASKVLGYGANNFVS